MIVLFIIPSNDLSNRNLRQFVCDGNEITYLPSRMIIMENLRLVNAKNTWLLPLFSKDESSTKPPVRRPSITLFSHPSFLLETTRTPNRSC